MCPQALVDTISGYFDVSCSYFGVQVLGACFLEEQLVFSERSLLADAREKTQISNREERRKKRKTCSKQIGYQRDIALQENRHVSEKS